MEYLLAVKIFLIGKVIFIKNIVIKISVVIFLFIKTYIWPYFVSSYIGTVVLKGVFLQDPIIMTVVLCTPFLILGSANFDTETRSSWWGDRFCIFFYCLMMGIFSLAHFTYWLDTGQHYF